jgi:hypothetical protein
MTGIENMWFDGSKISGKTLDTVHSMAASTAAGAGVPCSSVISSRQLL